MNRPTLPIPAEIQDFPSLLDWLIEKFHDGKPYRMSKRLGTAPALVGQWRDGKTKAPRGPITSKFCETYNLDEDEVHAIIEKRRPRALPPEVVDLKSLIGWIVKEHQEGHDAIAKRIGVSRGLVGQWLDGVVKHPKPKNLETLSTEYGLPVKEVRARLRPKAKR